MQPSSQLRLLFLMDPYASLNQDTETSLLLMTELRRRGHGVDWTELADLALERGQLRCRARAVQSLQPFRLGEAELRPATDYDAVLVRLDPPFDRNYLHLTQLLDFLPGELVQINPGQALRDLNEKLTALRFPDFCPDSLVSMDADRLRAFLARHGRIVVKPLDDCSGRGVARLDAAEAGVGERLAALLRDERGRPRFVQAQEFLPAIAQGDKRVYVLDGEVLGVVNRVPAPGNWLGNIHQGARVEAADLSEREHAAIAALRPMLQERGLMLAGLDFIGGYLTEVNITSPSALRQINAVSGQRLERRIVDVLEQRLGRARERRPADAAGGRPRGA